MSSLTITLTNLKLSFSIHHSPMKNLFLIADYGVGDPAFAEVVLQLRLFLSEQNVFIYSQSVNTFSTISTGFWIYQLALTKNIKDTFIYSNTAPRKHDKSEQKQNNGERLVYAQLENGVGVMAVHAGYVFSFVKPHIKKIGYVNVDNFGSQFRSRDKYPKVVAEMVKKGEYDDFVDQDKEIVIPDYPKNVIAFIDGYGNIKTTTKLSEINLKPGQKVTITINNLKHLATFTDGVFNIKEGELAFAPGSSGHDSNFMEIFVRGGSAKFLYGKPNVETPISIEPIV